LSRPLEITLPLHVAPGQYYLSEVSLLVEVYCLGLGELCWHNLSIVVAHPAPIPFQTACSHLATMQCIMVVFQIVVLLRALYWLQTLSMSIILAFNYFVLYKLLYTRLWFRIVPVFS